MPKTQISNKSNPIAQYFRETVGELRKVTWPTREETIRLSILVLIVLILASMFLGGLDILLSQLVTRIFA
jgi:preprotein translocase subunit SecE